VATVGAVSNPAHGERLPPERPAVVASSTMLGRLLSLVLGLAVVAYVAYWALTHVAGAERAGFENVESRSQPKAILDHTREAKKRIEQDAERRMNETERKMEER
jgi:hypothetical protein